MIEITLQISNEFAEAAQRELETFLLVTVERMRETPPKRSDFRDRDAFRVAQLVFERTATDSTQAYVILRSLLEKVKKATREEARRNEQNARAAAPTVRELRSVR